VAWPTPYPAIPYLIARFARTRLFYLGGSTHVE